MQCNRFLAMFASVCVVSSAANAAFLVPDGATGPFENWTRGDSNSTYAEWDVMTEANTPGENLPDVDESGLTGATIVQDGAFSIVTSTANIYSFSGPPAFDINLPAYDLGAGYNTRVVVQTGTIGAEPNLDSALLTYNDGSVDVAVTADYVVQGVDPDTSDLVTTYGFDVVGTNPGSFVFQFAASGAHLSLTSVAADTYAQSSAFAAFPAVVPEPSTVVIGLLAGLLSIGARRC